MSSRPWIQSSWGVHGAMESGMRDRSSAMGSAGDADPWPAMLPLLEPGDDQDGPVKPGMPGITAGGLRRSESGDVPLTPPDKLQGTSCRLQLKHAGYASSHYFSLSLGT